MKRTKPPFRADHVGSLLRPASLKAAREKRAQGEIGAAELKAVEDREIERVIKKQEEVGLQAVTDGEFRRSWWHLDFLWGLDGVERHVMDTGIAFAGVTTRNEGVRVTGKLGFSGHPMIEHFKFVQAHTKCTPKITIPAPSAIYGRPVMTPIDKAVYPELDRFFADLGSAYRKAVRAFADAGCRYLQLDEVFIAMLCDPKYRAQMTARGDNPERLGELYGDLINTAMSDIPSDMTITMHLCRGNYKSTFMGTGGYDAVQEILFNKIKVHGYFMEYDDPRSGGFEPLRMLPKGKLVVLGIATTKSGKLESKDELKRRIEQAAKYASLDQLCISGQCGFASTEEGNLLSEDEQWAKLRRPDEIVKAALAAFGRVDILVNNAGILRDRIFHRMSWSDWSDVLAVHLNGSFNMSRACAVQFREQNGGAFVHMTSTSALVGNFGQANYMAAKFGIVGLSRGIALDMQRFKVRSNCIAPFAWTRMIDSIPTETAEEKARVERMQQMTPEKIAPLAVYLASDRAEGISGQIFGVRNNEIFLFNQPRAVRTIHRSDGWTPDKLAQQLKGALGPSFTPLERSGDVFSWDPI